MLPICEDECQSDCLHEEFDIRVETRFSGYSPDGVDFSSSRIELSHLPKPEMIVTHLEEVDFNTLWGTIGGLAGLYLGLSVLSLYELIVEFFNYLRANNIGLVNTLKKIINN